MEDSIDLNAVLAQALYEVESGRILRSLTLLKTLPKNMKGHSAIRALCFMELRWWRNAKRAIEIELAAFPDNPTVEPLLQRVQAEVSILPKDSFSSNPSQEVLMVLNHAIQLLENGDAQKALPIFHIILNAYDIPGIYSLISRCNRMLNNYEEAQACAAQELIKYGQIETAIYELLMIQDFESAKSL